MQKFLFPRFSTQQLRPLLLQFRRTLFKPPTDEPFAGIYRTDGELCREDDLLVVQRKMNYHPGANVRHQRDRRQHLLLANCDGTVVITRERCAVNPRNELMFEQYAERNFAHIYKLTFNKFMMQNEQEEKNKKMEQFTAQLPSISGYDFNRGIQWEALMDSMLNTGFQASHLGVAIEEINAMIAERSQPVQLDPGVDPAIGYPTGRQRRALTIFLGFTSNLVTSGLREIFRYMVEHDQVDCVVTSAGGVEEDLIKCLRPTLLGNFKMSGQELRSMGINRAGNCLIPSANYAAFEDWLMPLLDKMLAEQREQGTRWTPSKLIRRLGAEIDCKKSICWWAAHNNIPIFCPALTDGALGDMLYFHSVKNDGNGIVLDIVEDLRHLNTMAVRSVRSGVIILGGGVVKHHINNANLMRNGSDRTVYINSGHEFDGSDSGAEPDEAVSWGKVKGDARAVKVCADATLVFPLVVARTFARAIERAATEGRDQRSTAGDGRTNGFIK